MRMTVATTRALAEAERIRKVRQLLEQHPAKLEEQDLPVQHCIGDQSYVRSLSIPAGCMVLGKRHNWSHHCILTQGEVLVSLNGAEVTRHTAPYSCFYERGAQRIIYALEDSVWVNVHAIPEGVADLRTIEAFLIDSDD